MQSFAIAYYTPNFVTMKREELEQLLLKRHVQPTAVRLMVLKALSEATQSLSLQDLDDLLDTVDKSSIFRTTLSIFYVCASTDRLID